MLSGSWLNRNVWRGILVTIAACWCIFSALFFLYPQKQDHGISELVPTSSVENIHNFSVEPRCAYVTFLCDDVMATATQVLVHSLARFTQRDIIVLVLSSVSDEVRDQLKHVGATRILEIDPVNYPWESKDAHRKGYNKACRYSKLLLWNLTEYDKVVFLDADTMVLQPLDELFERPEISAAMDVGGAMNTGVFVAEPSNETFNNMMAVYQTAPSYNRGDQGFLNWYFNASIHPLPGYYNIMIKFTKFSSLVSGYVQKKEAKVIHYTSETKPWNFHYLHHREWRDNYDGYLFGLWTRNRRAVEESLRQGGWSLKPEIPRISQVCNSSTFRARYNKKQFSVVLSLSPDTDIDYLKSLVSYLTSSKLVARVFVVSNRTVDVSAVISPGMDQKVETVEQAYASPNSRFHPLNNLRTEAVFLLSDKVVPSIQDMEFGYRVWVDHPDALVGFQALDHRSDQKGSRYSIISSGAMFMLSDRLYAYTCLLHEDVHRYIDEHPNCADIALNMLVNGMTHVKPVLVQSTDPFYHFMDGNSTLPRPSTISSCARGLQPMFGDTNTLLYNDAILAKTSSQQDQKVQVPLKDWRSLFDDRLIRTS